MLHTLQNVHYINIWYELYIYNRVKFAQCSVYQIVVSFTDQIPDLPPINGCTGVKNNSILDSARQNFQIEVAASVVAA